MTSPHDSSTTNHIFIAIFLVACQFLLSGCQLTRSILPSSSKDANIDPLLSIELEDVLKGEHLLAVLQNINLVLVDPDHPVTFEIYNLQSDEIPLTNKLDNFQLSPQKKFVVWYSPNKGLLKLNLFSKQVDIIRAPNEWLNQNPHFQFTDNPEQVHIIDNQGSDFVSIYLQTNMNKITSIPYPYGNLFQISPDGNSILFVSGFGQTDKFPQYMFTTLNGENPHQFITKADLNKRQLVCWLPDSSAVLLLSELDQILKIPRENPDTPSIFYEYSGEGNITDISLIDNQVYIFDTQVWSVVDPYTGQLIGRAPLEIAQELHRPKFYPWYDHQFLIEETIRLEPEQFSNLWISNFMGVKKKVLEKFHQNQITTDAPSI